MERWCIATAARVTTVSNVFADEIARAYGRNDVMVIPSCVNASRGAAHDADIGAVRRDCGFADDDIVFVYSGGLDSYQQLPRLIDLWHQFAQESNVRFLMLTNDGRSDARYDPLGRLALLGDRVVRRTVPPPDVPRWLAACDIGFVLREPRLMNRVASPVKFAE